MYDALQHVIRIYTPDTSVENHKLTSVIINATYTHIQLLRLDVKCSFGIKVDHNGDQNRNIHCDNH